ncbi:translation initiation factor eIF-2B alpha subunit [Tothia fuscella]|uniref:Translation initiation factor eIF2B subunit alpha n=1 Tax=Tothia fuscella TaxID=1048955 RepID=A0A9P4NVU4_9PEZI|nr:translation initiation factor eIF-2B alpha subunit [Tothia fuscella]
MTLHTPSTDFPIVSTYRRLLAQDPDLTMPVAAIESLVEALQAHPTSTISETLNTISTLSDTLIKSTANPISLMAGTDLFRRYLTTSLRPGSILGGSLGVGDFDAIRRHLLSERYLFVSNAKEARAQIASIGKRFVRDGCTVLTTGGSRVVAALLNEAAENSKSGGSIRFKVIYVLPSNSSSQTQNRGPEGADVVSTLREKGVPVATISEGAVAYAMGKVDMVIVGAEGVVENGGVISRLGTCQIGMLAKSAGKPFYVVAESHKFVRIFPLGQYDLPVDQNVVDFKVEDEKSSRGKSKLNDIEEGVEMSAQDGFFPSTLANANVEDAVDFTPPEYISGIITESGVLTPSAVSEELIKIWF